MKKLLSLALAFATVLTLVACGGSKTSTGTAPAASGSTAPAAPAAPAASEAAPAEEKFDRAAVKADLLVGTAASGGTWYVLGAAIADAVNQASGMNVSPATTSGTVDNIRLLSQGNIDIGMSQAPAEYHARFSEDLFVDTKIENINWISGGHYSKGQMVVPADSDIYTFEDLLGKQIPMGAVGSGSRNYTGRGTLLANGYDLDQFDVLAVNNAQGSEMMQDGEVQATYFSAGIGVSGILSIASVMDVRIIPTPDGAIEKLAETRPEWAAAMKYFTIPAGTYGDNFEDTQVLGFISNFLVRDDMDEDVVYAWLDYFAELAPTLTNVSKEASEYTMENISAGTCVTPHPGAVKWFADHGVTITDPLA
ncbi:MAG: TAXI family TRAP transporter solute-binding subunit [Oscillospiraceae bacterium]|nr:TAXI family TRAP transporter solute-binding subunit [Oscillospiraceae bacterium]